VTAGSRWSCPGARDEFGNSEQPQPFLRSPQLGSASPPRSHPEPFLCVPAPWYHHLPSSSPKTSPQNVPPSTYIQQTLPLLLCPSTLNSSRAAGRAACPESNTGTITPKAQARSPWLAGCSWEGSRAVAAALAGLRSRVGSGWMLEGWRSPPEPLSFTWHGRCVTSAGSMCLTTSFMQRFPWWYKYYSLIVQQGKLNPV